MTTKKQITAHKLANTDQAVEDLELTPLQFRLLALMVKLADGETGIVRRRQTELARKLGVHPRTMQRDRDQLVERGYLRSIGEARKGIVQAYRGIQGQHTAPAPYLTDVPVPGSTNIRSPRPQHTVCPPYIILPFYSPSLSLRPSRRDPSPAGLASALTRSARPSATCKRLCTNGSAMSGCGCLPLPGCCRWTPR